MKHLLTVLFAAALFAMPFGCQEQKSAEAMSDEELLAEAPVKEITADDVLGNMSPELDTLAETNKESWMRYTRAIDTTGRTFWDDLAKVLLWDRPLRMGTRVVP